MGENARLKDLNQHFLTDPWASWAAESQVNFRFAVAKATAEGSAQWAWLLLLLNKDV